MEMSRIANRNQGGQRVAHDRQPQRGKPCRRKNGEFEGQWNHPTPGLPSQTQPSRQRAGPEQWNRESALAESLPLHTVLPDRRSSSLARAWHKAFSIGGGVLNCFNRKVTETVTIAVV